MRNDGAELDCNVNCHALKCAILKIFDVLLKLIWLSLLWKLVAWLATIIFLKQKRGFAEFHLELIDESYNSSIFIKLQLKMSLAKALLFPNETIQKKTNNSQQFAPFCHDVLIFQFCRYENCWLHMFPSSGKHTCFVCLLAHFNEVDYLQCNISFFWQLVNLLKSITWLECAIKVAVVVDLHFLNKKESKIEKMWMRAIFDKVW